MRAKLKTAAVLLGLGLGALSTPAMAHCDSLDGPVVAAARTALDSGDPNPVLAWVKPDNEATVRQAFSKTLAVRALGREARELADQAFYETLVRLHRAGEGASYDGLKPSGHDFGPAVLAADEAVRSGSQEAVEELLSREVSQGLRARFANLLASRASRPRDVTADRAYVDAYVSYVHYVEGVHAAGDGKAAPPASGRPPPHRD